MESTISRHLATLALATIMVFGLGALATTSEAYAKTTDNSSFSFSMPQNGTSATSGRDKNDSSSCYVKISSISNPCRLYIDGRKTVKKGTWTNCTVGGYAKAKKAGKWRIKNTVHESGYGAARLTSWANSYSSTIKGAWSPDSVGSYTAINAS